jgi:hypothetical protein
MESEVSRKDDGGSGPFSADAKPFGRGFLTIRWLRKILRSIFGKRPSPNHEVSGRSSRLRASVLPTSCDSVGTDPGPVTEVKGVNVELVNSSQFRINLYMCQGARIPV